MTPKVSEAKGSSSRSEDGGDDAFRQTTGGRKSRRPSDATEKILKISGTPRQKARQALCLVACMRSKARFS